MNKIPNKFKTAAADLMVCGLGAIGEMNIRIEMSFAHHLDEGRLRKALRLLLDAEQVLGSRFTPGFFNYYWVRLAPDELERDILLLTENESEFQKFKIEFIDPTDGPQLRTYIYREPTGDRLLINYSHEASDAGGVKHATRILSEIYNRLEQEPDYRPTPNVGACRGIWQVFKRLPLFATIRVFINFCREAAGNLYPPGTLSCELGIDENQELLILEKHLDSKQRLELNDYLHGRHSTVNDITIAALLRAVAEYDSAEAVRGFRAASTVDLRRWYLPDSRAEAVCNLSAFEFPNISPRLGADMDETLARVDNFMNRRKENFFGINMLASIPLLKLMPAAWVVRMIRSIFGYCAVNRLFPPSLTNMGPIEENEVCFGKPPETAWLIAPPIYGPIFLLGISGYRQTLTFTLSVKRANIADAEKLFDLIFEKIAVGSPEES